MSKVNWKLRRELLPHPAEYFRSQGLKLLGGGEWKKTLCPFHDDTNPSLYVRLDKGCFSCKACHARGGDIINFHMLRYKLSFKDAVRELGALEVVK